MPGLADEQIPLGGGELSDGVRIAQGCEQVVHASSLASCSKTAMASSSRLYSKLKLRH